jgi:glyoxylase-like metal-dependent hydrolase (beta-lactamase superfamily II)
MNVSNVSRRSFLKSLGAGAAGAGLAATGFGFFALPTSAQGTAPAFGSFYRTNVGEYTLTVVQDRVGAIPSNVLAANADPADLTALLEANNLPLEQQKATFNVILLEAGERRILFDTGNGAGAGLLVETLAILGVPADTITDVLISHIHPDHVGGVSSDAGISFPNATYHIGETEKAFLDTGAIASSTAKLQPVIDAGMLNVMPDSGEWLPGISAMPSFGHTPGHLAFMIANGDDALLSVVDAANNSIVSVARPDWALGFDADPAAAASARRALFEMAAADGIKVFGYHFAFPGIGYIVAEGEGYRFVQVNG